jgi:hypothetical protein
VIDDLVDRLATRGIDIPALEPLPLAVGVTAMGFPSEGDAALAWWRRLRAVHEPTGFWPVLVPSVEEAVDASGKVEAGPGERLARAVEMDGAEVLNPQGATFESLDDQRRQDMLEKWPEAPGRIDGFGLPYLRNGQPAPVLVALVAAESGWQVPTLLDYGYWNDCPEPAVHGAVLRRWYHRYGAELVCMTANSLELAVTRPPRTRLEALAFAWEYPRYCLDGMDLYDADDVPDLAACLIDAEVVRLWWD